MPSINPVKCVELLYHLHATNKEAWLLSKNPELTKILEEQREMIEVIIKTIEDAFGEEEEDLSQ